jgi:hypothetical protein
MSALLGGAVLLLAGFFFSGASGVALASRDAVAARVLGALGLALIVLGAFLWRRP